MCNINQLCHTSKHRSAETMALTSYNALMHQINIPYFINNWTWDNSEKNVPLEWIVWWQFDWSLIVNRSKAPKPVLLSALSVILCVLGRYVSCWELLLNERHLSAKRSLLLFQLANVSSFMFILQSGGDYEKHYGHQQWHCGLSNKREWVCNWPARGNNVPAFRCK